VVVRDGREAGLDRAELRRAYVKAGDREGVRFVDGGTVVTFHASPFPEDERVAVFRITRPVHGERGRPPGEDPVGTCEAIRRKLLEISAAADTAAEALGGAAVDIPAPELARHLAALEALARRLGEVCSHLAAGVDPARPWR
jgi:hypothetical protein